MRSHSPSTASTWPAKRVLVMGLGRFGGGVGVTRWLIEQGAAVTVTDLASPDSLADSLAALADCPITLRLGGHDPADLDAADLVVVNPAVPRRHSPFFQEILRRKIPWTTELNLFCERCPAEVIGVTGTYGKSTTCAMLAAALRSAVAAGRAPFTAVHLGGNIGVSLLGELPRIHESDVVVLEMSDAQLESLPQIDWHPAVAVLTNLWPHHLDRHGTLEAYAAAKLNIIGPPHRTRFVVRGPLHPTAADLLARRLADLGHPPECAQSVISHVPDLTLRVAGAHNRENAACVHTVCRALGLDDRPVLAALRDFPGLPHRLEHVAEINGVEFINDSKSTSPAATLVALQCMSRPTIAIVGGQTKDVPLHDLATALADRCRAVIFTGESGTILASEMARKAEKSGPKCEILVEKALENATKKAFQVAKSGEIVLFSPGFPSFDSHANFAERGEAFRQEVLNLASVNHFSKKNCNSIVL